MRCAAVFLMVSATVLSQTLVQGDGTTEKSESTVLALAGEDATIKITFDRTVKNFPTFFLVKIFHKKAADTDKPSEIFSSTGTDDDDSYLEGMRMQVSTSSDTVTVVGKATRALPRHDGIFTCTVVSQDSSGEPTFEKTQKVRLIIVDILSMVTDGDNDYTPGKLRSGAQIEEGRHKITCLITSTDKVHVDEGIYMKWNSIEQSTEKKTPVPDGSSYRVQRSKEVEVQETQPGVSPTFECGVRYKNQILKRGPISVNVKKATSKRGSQNGREISHDAAESGLDFAMSGSSQNGLKGGSDYLLVSLGTLVLCVARALWQG